ncbi:hypothetical protein BS50DRAFT_380597 [Corynespora cassiicola Philippines]|uniref:Uncharacterized protein n=1 Tax=Corynespora cassiicola Philippines TaxID=1448308 RepID=A0A2T2NP55_CORCC|nr:hypothetical protein BS50DRAFT_380597 [Corynespora cassiicola Philippines]
MDRMRSALAAGARFRPRRRSSPSVAVFPRSRATIEGHCQPCGGELQLLPRPGHGHGRQEPSVETRRRVLEVTAAINRCRGQMRGQGTATSPIRRQTSDHVFRLRLFLAKSSAMFSLPLLSAPAFSITRTPFLSRASRSRPRPHGVRRLVPRPVHVDRLRDCTCICTESALSR